MQDRLLSLRDFTHRSHVLQLYRRYLRVVKGLPAHARASALEQIQQSFRAHGTMSRPQPMALSPGDKRSLLAEGEKQLKYLSSYVSTAADNPLFGNAAAGDSGLPQHGIRVEDGDAGVRDDVRGRIGVEWPWQEK